MSEETTKKASLPVTAGNDPEIKLEETPSNGEMTEEQSKTTPNVSDYDSADSYSDRENGSISGSESEGSVIFEREEGDGQESTPSKKVDDDEDKKNPQYIPKRGTFYEHDDRTADDLESPESDKTDKDSKKKVWQDKKEKWSHDRFNDTEQAPKSRSELISIYGYDIRNEDGPPRARRRRRYGRGPNKYTRNWEDVDAYGKPIVIRKTTKKRIPKSQSDEFESIDQEQSGQEISESSSVVEEVTKDESVQPAKDQRIPNNSSEEIKSPTLPQQSPHQKQQQQQHPPQSKDTPRQNISNYHHQSDNRQQSNKNSRVGTGRVSKPKREFTDSDYRGFTKSRQFKSSPTTKIHSRNPHNSNANKNNVQEIEKDMGKMSIHDGGGGSFKANLKHNNQRQGSMPPRLQAEQKGSKRYSSIRQRSLPETTNPPFLQHANYYGNEFNQQNQTSQPQPTMITNNTLHPTNAQLPQIPTQTLPPIPAQVPVTTTPILQAPPQFAPPFPPAPPFLQPGVVPPTSFLPQQTPPILNYVQGQPQYPQPPPYQGYQQPFNAVNQPTELYQPQGGITYYSTQEQQAAQRAAPPKRPKAAIPIVAPPEHRGRGRATIQVDPSINMENDNNLTEAVVENVVKFEDIIETAAQS